MNADYEYRGLLASTWDLLRRDAPSWPDRSFYLEVVARYGQPVLDVGCGTGRLLLDYLQAGIDIDGVDVSPEMLALCRVKAERLGLRPTLHGQSMETLELSRRYRTVLVPSSSFQLVVDPEQARETMRRFFAHLQPGGALAMPFMILHTDGEPEETDWRERVEIRLEDGAQVRRRSRSRYDSVNHVEHTEDIYEIFRDGAVIASEHHRRSPAVRWYSQDEAAALYRTAGFAEVRSFREFIWEPARSSDRIFSVLGTRS